jgi:hypothetical protein
MSETKSETEVDSESFRSALLVELRPVGALQELVAERIILANWRLMRGAGARRPEMLRVYWYDGESRVLIGEHEMQTSDDAVEAMTPGEIARYDASIARQLRRDLEQLGGMQGRVIGSREAVGSSRPNKSTRRR